MRLQREELEVACNTALGNAPLRSDRAHAPVRRAVARLDGLMCSVVLINCATRSSSIVRGLPGRVSSWSPAIRRSMKRVRHLPTVALVSFRRSAIALFGSPSALLIIKRAR